MRKGVGYIYNPAIVIAVGSTALMKDSRSRQRDQRLIRKRKEYKRSTSEYKEKPKEFSPDDIRISIDLAV